MDHEELTTRSCQSLVLNLSHATNMSDQLVYIDFPEVWVHKWLTIFEDVLSFRGPPPTSLASWNSWPVYIHCCTNHIRVLGLVDHDNGWQQRKPTRIWLLWCDQSHIPLTHQSFSNENSHLMDIYNYIMVGHKWNIAYLDLDQSKLTFLSHATRWCLYPRCNKFRSMLANCKDHSLSSFSNSFLGLAGQFWTPTEPQLQISITIAHIRGQSQSQSHISRLTDPIKTNNLVQVWLHLQGFDHLISLGTLRYK